MTQWMTEQKDGVFHDINKNFCIFNRSLKNPIRHFATCLLHPADFVPASAGTLPMSVFAAVPMHAIAVVYDVRTISCATIIISGFAFNDAGYTPPLVRTWSQPLPPTHTKGGSDFSRNFL